MTAVSVPLVAASRFLGLLIAVFGAGLIVLELFDRPRVSDFFFAKRRSNNVLGLVPANINDEIGEPARRVILTAHLDTGRGGLLWHHVVVRSFRLIAIGVLASALMIPVLLLVYTIWQITAVWIVSWVLMAILLLAAILLAESELNGTPLLGANDNASGVAALLAAATALERAHLDHVETWFLFTTGLEAGLTGMNRFLDENSFNVNTTYFINVDHVGSGHVHYTRAEGLLRTLKSSPPLTRLAADIASHHPEWNATSEVYRLLPTDQYAALRRGYQAITIMALDQESYLPHWHQVTDTHDTVNLETIQVATDLVLALIRRLDAEVRERTDSSQRAFSSGETVEFPTPNDDPKDE